MTLEAKLVQQRQLTCRLGADYPAVNDHAHLQMRVRKIWEYVPCTDCTGQENDFELILTVKMVTRHPIEVSFGGSEFPSICNHCGVMAA